MFTKEQIEVFNSRTCDFKLSYEDCALLGLALCAEREQIFKYLMQRDSDCDCDKCHAARARLRAIGASLDTIRAGVMATWPEFDHEAHERRANGPDFSDDAKRMAADLLSQITGKPVSSEEIHAVHIIEPGDDPDLDPADFARFSPTVGHG